MDNIGIIGLGLIGGSLARAIKKNNYAKVIGYAKSEESCNKALELGIIDSKANSASRLAEKSDIIVICAPLGAYPQIAKEIASVVSGDCIITDAGSVKGFVADKFSKYLDHSKLKNLVPAHPIAGTEKTGVESGFAELFSGKKTILTPSVNTSPEAIAKVSKLWRVCGSHTEIMDAARHDKIYAEVSHLPQFLAYCYADFCTEHGFDIGDGDDAFRRFTRICSSDMSIWRDIFRLNKENLLASRAIFIDELGKTNAATAQISTQPMLALAGIISSALIKCSPNASQYAGSGFKDFTSYKLQGAVGKQVLDGFINKCNQFKF